MGKRDLRRWARLIQDHGPTCPACGRFFSPNPVEGRYPVRDLQVPRYWGGGTGRGNVVVVCRDCDRARGSGRTPVPLDGRWASLRGGR